MIGLIAGSGQIPSLLSQSLKEKNTEFVIFGLEGLCDRHLRKKVEKFYSVKLTNLEELFSIFKRERIDSLLLAGKVPKINAYLPQKVIKFNSYADEEIKKRVFNFLEKEGFKILSQKELLKDFFLPDGFFYGLPLNEEEKNDVEFSLNIAGKLADLDIAQTIIVSKRNVVAIEGMEGTDQTIQRAGKLIPFNTAVMCKSARTNQDPRFDLPTVGWITIKNLIRIRAKILCLKGDVLFLEQQKSLRFAQKYNLRIIKFN